MSVRLTSGYGVFGTATRTKILLLIFLLGESHAAELARLAGVHLSTAQKSIDSLEQVGLVSGAIEGRERRIRLNPRYFAREELATLLEKLPVPLS